MISGNWQQAVEQLSQVLAERLVAVYQYGDDLAGLPEPQVRLLVLVDTIDRRTLERVAETFGVGADARVRVRVDTADNLMRGADTFPVFTLDVIATKRLVTGEDLLRNLAVRPADLRLHVERGLRAIHRDLVTTFMNFGSHRIDDATLGKALLSGARKLFHLLEGALLVSRVQLPTPVTARSVVSAVTGSLLGDASGRALDELQRYVGFELELNGDALADLYDRLFAAMDELIARVDYWEQVTPKA